MILEVLLVDDEQTKADRICETISTSSIASLVSVKRVKSAQRAAVEMSQCRFDLMILDLNLPTYDDGEPIPDGGQRLLENLDVVPGLIRPTMIVGLTAYGDRYSESQHYFRSKGWPLLAFRYDSDEWCSTVFSLIVHLAESKAAGLPERYDFDVAIVTALSTPELAAVLELEAGWKECTFEGDDTIYYDGVFSRGAAAMRVVACSAVQMGMAASAALSMKVIWRFRPRYLVMVGIAAGLEGEPGDVLIADQTWDYDAGKVWSRPWFGLEFLELIARKVFEPAPRPQPLSPYLSARVDRIRRRQEAVVDGIRRRWKGKQVLPERLSVRVGGLASGAAVLADKAAMLGIKKRDRKLVGIEMEAYAVYLAAALAPAPRPYVMAVKAICDFGDYRKNNEWQAYAAFTSANFVYEFCLSELALSAELTHRVLRTE